MCIRDRKKVLRKKRVIVAPIVAAVTIVLCYGGYLFLHLPIMGGSIESVHSVSVEEETGRLVVGLQPDYGGLGGLHPVSYTHLYSLTGKKESA